LPQRRPPVPLLSPLAYAAIGDIALALGRARRRAFGPARGPNNLLLPQAFVDSLQRKMAAIATKTPESLGVFIGLAFGQRPLQKPAMRA